MCKAKVLSLLLVSLAGAPLPAHAQIDEGDIMSPVVLLITGRFGHAVARAYNGYITWSWIVGDMREHVSLKLKENGEVMCDVNYESKEGAWTASGPGLLEFSLGLDPDEDMPGRKGNMYSIRGACPHAKTYPRTRAEWSHSFDTYKQPGGAYTGKPTREGLLLTGLPREMKGGYRITAGEENTSMAWRFCLGAKTPCEPTPLPPAPPPAANRQ